MGCIANHQVVILVDGSSTHNFIQKHLVHQLGLPTQTTPPLNVMVGNGHHLDCRHVCPALAVHIQDIVFNIDLHVLLLCGTHIVLGVQWLKSLWPVLTDYNDLSMKFSRNGRVIEFKGDIASNLSLLTPSQLRRLVRKSGASALFHICILPTELPSDQAPPNQLLPKIQTLITKFISLYQQPSTLPLSRPTNHHIHTFLPTRTQ